ncbi:hypothetical protein BC833DRAFT_456897 [Globomyces pollinis-pini]|nr:hypothetical protein BC833DRAFT_456897 [Globomyces pollinis-pini]KAJ2999128.1 hypothetical protein HDV02_003417 [Globomyces sp. JEL0801]
MADYLEEKHKSIDINTKNAFTDQTTDFDAVKATPAAGGRNILVAVDLSDDAAYAIEFAIKNLFNPPDLVTFYIALEFRHLNSDDTQANIRREKMILIHNQVSDLKKKFNKEFLFRVHGEMSTDARASILNKLKQKERSYTMLVIGSRGQSLLEGVVLGSVSNYLLQKSPVPVVVVRQP